MNFFGHAWIAGWFSQQEPFVLGSMLPDLANMLRLPAPSTEHPDLAAGIGFHHETDRAFHASRAFTELERGALSALSGLGFPKGARRALAHVGVEFLIDEQLALEAPAWSGYHTALEFGGSAASRGLIAWGSAQEEQRFALLCRRLAALSHGRDGIPALVKRLFGTLAGRPRLALAAESAPHLAAWLAAATPLVSQRLPDLLAELEHALQFSVDRAGRGLSRREKP
jgi:hypothetical protein